jgi:signal transduction histidine kinase
MCTVFRTKFPGVSLHEGSAADVQGYCNAEGWPAEGSVDAVMEKLTGDLRQPARYTSTRRDGRVLEAVRDPLPDGGFILTYVDISASQPTQDAAQAAINPALQAPLSTIIGLAQALQPDAPAQADQLQSIRAAGVQLLAVIDDMLQAASAETQPMPAIESPTP